MKTISIRELEKQALPREIVEVLARRGIRELNPIQTEAIRKGLFNDVNLVVTAPTASGKTLIGELAIIKHVLRGEMGIYLVPLRALANEKYEEFQAWSDAGLRIGISTGDYESPGEYLGRYDILVATYERFDSLLRLNPSWLKRIGCVVVDELHMVGDPERGPILEMIIARLLESGAQIVGLSATVGNPHELAKWLKAELVDTPWRPVKLVEGVYDRRSSTIVFYDESGYRREKVIHRLGNPAISIALQSITRGYQVLVFVNNRRRAEDWALAFTEHMKLLKHMMDRRAIIEVLEELRDSPSKNERDTLSYLIEYGVAYHHAGLSSTARRVVEKAFRKGVVKVVFATPTLAAGVNLPARRVLVSIKRYDPVTRRMKGIHVFEYKQMAGRAGRPQYDPYGEAIIYDASGVDEGLRYIRGRLEPVESKLSNERSLRIHTLALIATGKARSIDDVLKIYEKTLFKLQYGSVRGLRSRIEGIVKTLVKWDMVREGDGLYATKLGYITSVTYLDPLSVVVFTDNLPENKDPGTLWILHLIASTPDYTRSRPYISRRIIDEYEDEALEMAEDKIIPRPDIYDEYEYYKWLQSYVQAKMLHDWINEVREDDISSRYGVGPGDIYSARDTASWISGALSHVMDVIGEKKLAVKLSRLAARLEHGVKEDALELVELKGIGRVRARILIRNGIRSLKDLAETPVEKLTSLPGFGPRLVESILKQLEEKGYSIHGETRIY